MYNVMLRLEAPEVVTRKRSSYAHQLGSEHYAAFWEYGNWSLPYGGAPLAVTFEPRILRLQENHASARLRIVNTTRERSVAEGVRLSGLAGWRISPNKVDVSLPAGGSTTVDIFISAPENVSSGLIRAHYRSGSANLYDTLRVGEVPPVELIDGPNRVVLSGTASQLLKVALRNPTPQRLKVTVAALAPPEAWALTPTDMLQLLPSPVHISPLIQESNLAEEQSSASYITAVGGSEEGMSWVLFKVIHDGFETKSKPIMIESRI